VINDPTVSISLDNNSVCEGGTATYTATVSGGIGTASYQWQYNDPGTGWTNVPFATEQMFSVLYNIDGTYEHRVNVTMSQGCNGTSSGLILNVNDDPAITVSADASDVCVGALVNLTASITGGSTQLSYHWQSSPNGVSDWIDLGASNSAYVVPTGAAGTFYFRARVSDPSSGCPDPNSNAVTVVVNGNASVSVSPANSEICVGGSALLTSIVTGGSAGLTRQWQVGTSISGPWTSISGQTNTTYSPPTGASGTFYYRMTIDDPGLNCAEQNSNAAVVVIREDPTVSVVANNAEVCVGGNVTLTATITNGTALASVQWQSATATGGPWNDIGSATNLVYSAPTSTAGTVFYRVRVIDNGSGCEDPNSNELQIVVNPDISISANVNNAQVCIGGVATLTASLTGGSSSATLQWESGTSTTGPWTDIAGETNAVFSSPTSASGVFYYRVRVSDSSSGCEAQNSAAVTVTVYPDATIDANVNNAEVCVGGSAALTATLTGGSGSVSLQWQSGTSTAGPWTDLAGQTSTIYNAPTGAPGTFYYRVRVIDPNSGCATPFSDAVTVEVTPDATISASVDNAEVCIDARRVAEVKTASPGKAEDRLHDLSAGLAHRALERFEIVRVEDDQRAAASRLRLSSEAAVQAAVLERDVVRAVVRELPAECLRVERLDCGEVGRAELDVVDAAIVIGLGHESSPRRSARVRAGRLVRSGE
jgi:hypothetical protein